MMIQIVVISLVVLLGIMLSLGKWSFLIAGFNTMSKEEKKSYDVIGLCKFMGKFMFFIAFCIILQLLSDIFTIKSLADVGQVLFIVSIIFIIIYTNTGNRFKNKKYEKNKL